MHSLTATLCRRMVRDTMAGYLQPIQMGFGTAQGCEATINAIGAFAHTNEGRQAVIIKIDLKNAFNSVERDIIFGENIEPLPLRRYHFNI